MFPSILASSARLPPRGFTYFLTLSSKFFSTFPHGTCSLSVSWSYLALDGVYHPLSAPLSRNTTLRRAPTRERSRSYGPGTLCGRWPRSRETWTRRTAPRECGASHTRHLPARRRAGFRAGLFPVRSPLLGESLLVSFPPPSNMLKFSG